MTLFTSMLHRISVKVKKETMSTSESTSSIQEVPWGVWRVWFSPILRQPLSKKCKFGCTELVEVGLMYGILSLPHRSFRGSSKGSGGGGNVGLVHIFNLIKDVQKKFKTREQEKKELEVSRVYWLYFLLAVTIQ